MEDIPQSVEVVDVVRHSFRPSRELGLGLGAFVRPGLERPRFSIKTVSSLILDSTINHGLGLHEARQEVERGGAVDFQLGPKLAARRMPSGALKILMQIDHTLNKKGEDVSLLNYLGMINRTSNHVPDARPERDLEAQGFTFYTIIAGNLALSNSEIVRPGKALLSALKSPITNPLYQVHLDSLTVAQEERDVLPEYEQPLEQAS